MWTEPKLFCVSLNIMEHKCTSSMCTPHWNKSIYSWYSFVICECGLQNEWLPCRLSRYWLADVKKLQNCRSSTLILDTYKKCHIFNTSTFQIMAEGDRCISTESDSSNLCPALKFAFLQHWKFAGQVKNGYIIQSSILNSRRRIRAVASWTAFGKYKESKVLFETFCWNLNL